MTIDSGKINKERRYTVAKVQATLKAPVQMNERADTPNTCKNWKDTIYIPPEYAAYRTQFINLLEHFKEMWNGYFGKIITATHRYKLSSPDARPNRAVPDRAGSKARRAEKKEIDKMLALKVIEPAKAEHDSSILLAPKKDRTPRFCIENRKRNAVSDRDSYRLPRMDD